MRRLMLGCLCVTGVIGGALVTSAAAQQPTRDTPVQAPPVAGTAIIAGSVVTGETPGQPVRRARVTLNNAGRDLGRSATTDDNGRFLFRALPAGRYTLQASKPAWLTTTYGATRPGRPGTPLVLAEGQQLTGLSIAMPRGAVVTGAVRYPDGQPAPGVTVEILKYLMQNGVRVQAPSGPGSRVTTDNRGVYRVFSLPPGDVVVLAQTQAIVRNAASTEFREIAPGEVDRAIQMSRDRGRGGAPGGLPPAALTPAGPTVDFAPVFYPGVFDAASATTLSLAAGEERGGVDITLQLVPTARVEGVVTTADGLPMQDATVFLAAGGPLMGIGLGVNGINIVRTDKDGKYRLSGIAPGSYTLAAGGGPRPHAAGAVERDAPELSAQTEIAVNGLDLTVPLTLQPSMTIAGRVVFDGASPPKEAALSVRIRGIGGMAQLVGRALGSTVAGGAFSFPGEIPAGKYQLTFSGLPGDRWFLKSSIARGQETLDAPLEIATGENVMDWVVTFTDRPSELRGRLQDASGRPAPDYFVIVFATDRARWTPSSRWIAQTRPAADGAFSIKGLPTGEYFVAALTDVEPGEWFSPAFLEQVLGAAVKVTLTEGASVTRDFKISK